MSGFKPSEIISPKQTLKRRETEAEGETPPEKGAAPSKTMTQSEFTSGGPARRKADDAKRQQKFLELMKKQQAPLPN